MRRRERLASGKKETKGAMASTMTRQAPEVRRNKKEEQASCEKWARAMGERKTCEEVPGKHDNRDEVQK
jgi:hypothetical protein